MKDIKTAEEFENNYDYLCVEIKNTDNNSEQIFVFAQAYAEYLLKATVESIDKNELISSIRTAPSRKDADAYFNWWLENKLLNDL